MKDNKFYNSAMIALGCFLGLGAMFIVAVIISTANTKDDLEKFNEEHFYNKCQAACLPNGVFSTKYNRCMCDVNVVYKEVK